MRFRSGNPALSPQAFERVEHLTGAEAMTLEGTANKAGLLLLLILLTSGWTWSLFFRTGNPAAVMPYLWGGLIGGLVVALVTVFKKHLAMYTSPAYALLQGLFIGSLSAIFEARYPGIVLHAVALTFGTLLAMLTIYRARLIPVTQNFKMGIAAATGGIMLLYLATLALGFFGVRVPYIHESGLIGIGFSVFVVTLAALNLILDFDLIENGVRAGAPKYMEWYGAFALMVTLIWLYIEILRLLAKLRSRR
jgi:uncharacterized YccA/Bax inhibitor family protein